MAVTHDDPTDVALAVPQGQARAPRSRPGLVVVWEDGRPACRAVAFDGDSLTIGRGEGCRLALADGSVSRRHARVALEPTGLGIDDLDSRHGTRVDGEPVEGRRALAPDGCVLRLGAALVLAVPDVAPFLERGVERAHGRVTGPTLARALAVVPLAARSGVPMLVQGESGSGKEAVARLYHDTSTRRAGPYVELNSPNLPRDLVEAELFGTRRGGYSGAVDRDGLIARAHGGTVFLDEIGDLDLAVQPRLLRVLETATVTPVGGDRPRPVDVRFVTATHRDVEAMIEAGTFRQDLFVRLSHERVLVPPLRERREEIPWLVALALERAWASAGLSPLPASVSLVEACCLRGWHGENVRGLLRTVGAAARAAATARAVAVDDTHLAPVRRAAEPTPAPYPRMTPSALTRAARKDAFLAALAGSDVATAAAAAGVSLATAYRWKSEG